MKALFSLNSKLFSQVTIPVLLAVLLLVTGCRTLPQETIASFAGAASAARSNSQEVFAAVDELISEASIDYAAAQPTLSEASFVAGLDQNGLELWDQALRSLASLSIAIYPEPAMKCPERHRYVPPAVKSTVRSADREEMNLRR